MQQKSAAACAGRLEFIVRRFWLHIMIYRENISYPGYGYIEPIMDQDDPLRDRDVAEKIIEYHMNTQAVLNALRDAMHEECFLRFLIDNPGMGEFFGEE